MVSPWYANGDINTYIDQRAADPDIENLKFNLVRSMHTSLEHYCNDAQVVDVLTGLGFRLCLRPFCR